MLIVSVRVLIVKLFNLLKTSPTHHIYSYTDLGAG